jgi:hypothetical protein
MPAFNHSDTFYVEVDQVALDTTEDDVMSVEDILIFEHVCREDFLPLYLPLVYSTNYSEIACTVIKQGMVVSDGSRRILQEQNLHNANVLLKSNTTNILLHVTGKADQPTGGKSFEEIVAKTFSEYSKSFLALLNEQSTYFLPSTPEAALPVSGIQDDSVARSSSRPNIMMLIFVSIFGCVILLFGYTLFRRRTNPNKIYTLDHRDVTEDVPSDIPKLLVALNWDRLDACEAAVDGEGLIFPTAEDAAGQQADDPYLDPKVVRTNSIPNDIGPLSWVEPTEDISSSHSTEANTNMLFGLEPRETATETSCSGGTGTDSSASLNRLTNDMNFTAKFTAGLHQLTAIEESDYENFNGSCCTIGKAESASVGGDSSAQFTTPESQAPAATCCPLEKAEPGSVGGDLSTQLTTQENLAPDAIDVEHQENAQTAFALDNDSWVGFENPSTVVKSDDAGGDSWFDVNQPETEPETDGLGQFATANKSTFVVTGFADANQLADVEETVSANADEDSSVGLNTLAFSKIVKTASAAAKSVFSHRPNKPATTTQEPTVDTEINRAAAGNPLYATTSPDYNGELINAHVPKAGICSKPPGILRRKTRCGNDHDYDDTSMLHSADEDDDRALTSRSSTKNQGLALMDSLACGSSFVKCQDGPGPVDDFNLSPLVYRQSKKKRSTSSGSRKSKISAIASKRSSSDSSPLLADTDDDAVRERLQTVIFSGRVMHDDSNTSSDSTSANDHDGSTTTREEAAASDTLPAIDANDAVPGDAAANVEDFDANTHDAAARPNGAESPTLIGRLFSSFFGGGAGATGTGTGTGSVNDDDDHHERGWW